MVHILATIFFSAAATSALGVIVGAFAENIGDVRVALGLFQATSAPPSVRVRVRRTDRARSVAMASVGSPLRAAA